MGNKASAHLVQTMDRVSGGNHRPIDAGTLETLVARELVEVADLRVLTHVPRPSSNFHVSPEGWPLPCRARISARHGKSHTKRWRRGDDNKPPLQIDIWREDLWRMYRPATVEVTRRGRNVV